MDTLELMQQKGLTKELRNLQIIARARAGESLRSIANDYGISGEAVRRILLRKGEGSVRDMRQENAVRTLAARQKLSEVVEGWVKLHPGCTYAEIADQFSVNEDLAKEAARTVQYLVVKGGRRQTPPTEGLHARWHLADACAALATAAEICSPLTREKYDELRLEGAFQGPSGAWITSQFPSWKDACHQAGVTCGEPRRGDYNRKWTAEDMLDWIGRYFLETLDGTSNGYDLWSRDIEGAPSWSRIRVEFKSWLPARNQALLRLRDNWDN